MNKTKLEFTKLEFNLLVDAIGNLEAMVGAADPQTDDEFNRIVRNLDKMLKRNGYERSNI